MSEQPERTALHDRLEVFLGEWRAEGTSHGNGTEPWRSSHSGRWHTGQFFLIQDERAMTGDNPFDTLSVMGVEGERYIARSFENHGFYRHYEVTNDGRVWTFTGDTERARITFSEDNRTQDIVWEWKPKSSWVPLCERTARRVD